MQSKMLWRGAAATGLAVLLTPGVAAASWWDGGYDRRYDGGHRGGGGSHSSFEGGPAPEVGPTYGCENSDRSGMAPALQKTTTPPAGTPVAPGDEILVNITWRVSDWSAPFLHKALDCVYINGVFVPGLSLGEHDTANDGHFGVSYRVPLDAPAGATICDQGFLSGPNGWDDYHRTVSNVVCFPISLRTTRPPAAGPTTTSTTAKPKAGPTTTTTTTRKATGLKDPTPSPRSERPDQGVPAAKPVMNDRQVLPRTGSGSEVAQLAAGGLILLSAIRRKARRR